MASSFSDFIKNNRSEVSTATTHDLRTELEKRESHLNVFPLEIFNPKIKPFINDMHVKYDIPRAYIGLSILSAYSTAIGTAYAISRNGSDRMSLSVWGCMNGISSSGKSYALDVCMQPLAEIQEEFDRDWDDETRNLTDEKRQHSVLKTVIYRDAYIPTLIRTIMPDNPKGLLKDSDEILEWINGLNALAKKESTDEQFWISAWDGKKYSAIRSGKVKATIPRVFTNVIGGIQPSLLYKLFKNDRDQSGFIFRLLFASPETFKIAKPVHGYDMPSEFKDVYTKHVKRMYNDLPVSSGFDDPKICIMSKEATSLISAWEDKISDTTNLMTDVRTMSIHSSILGKMKAYAYRFAAILTISDRVFDMEVNEYHYSNTISITAPTMERALKAADYFYRSAVDIFEVVDNSITAPVEVLQIAAYFKMGKPLNQIADLIHLDKYKSMSVAAKKQAMRRKLNKAVKDYPKVFGAQPN